MRAMLTTTALTAVFLIGASGAPGPLFMRAMSHAIAMGWLPL